MIVCVVSIDSPLFSYTFYCMHVFAHCYTIIWLGLFVVSSMRFSCFSMAYLHVVVAVWLLLVPVVNDC